MFSQPIATQDLMKDDLIPFTHGDGSSDLLGIESVDWQDNWVEVSGLALVAGIRTVISFPFNGFVEVWNA